MKLVIDIPEIMYEEIKEYGIRNFSALTDSIRNATPLTDCTDAISRKAVIEVISNKKAKHIDDRVNNPINYGTLADLEQNINSLPSVNPTTDLSKIRAEIESRYLDGINEYRFGVNVGLSTATTIIDKHIKGGDSDA